MGCKIIGYYRVSTDRRGRSGLGLEGQEVAVHAYATERGCDLLASYTEVETGTRDTLENRPALQKALAHAKRSKAILVIAKLDRLARSVYVTAELHRSGVEFVATDNPVANRFTIQILAAIAEDEARRISERTKTALAAYKARGGRLGASRPESRNLTMAARKKGAIAASKVIRQRALDSYSDLAPRVVALRSSGRSLRQIADALNDDGHTTRRGRPWNPVQVQRVLDGSGHGTAKR
jgi:DNA invertase Pin-like site-specific DNA recombinase